MASLFKRSMRTLFGLAKRDRLRRELKAKLDEHDRQFLKTVTDPKFEDGHIHQQYQQGIIKIRSWYDVASRKG